MIKKEKDSINDRNQLSESSFDNNYEFDKEFITGEELIKAVSENINTFSDKKKKIIKG